MAKRKQFGGWQVVRQIGAGGNGEVYHCQAADGTGAAVKVLRRGTGRQRDRIARFRTEIAFLIEQRDRPGVLPLLDHSLPDDPVADSWYAMPLAEPLLQALGAAPELSRVVEAIERVARALSVLAAGGISHRDIKPDNLFWWNGEWVIGDFGLVKYPEKEPATKAGRPLGPYYFIAPEMRRNADTADAERADVYSLAKTLWALGANRPEDPPPGELRRDRSELKLSSFSADRRASLLEQLLERATSNDPGQRPTMQEFAEELSWWSTPDVPARADVSKYVDDVRRLREAATVIQQETDRQRLERLYGEALKAVSSGVTDYLVEAMATADLQPASAPRAPEGWAPENYGGRAIQPCWAIEGLASPWLGASIGVVHRAQPEEDLNDLAVTAIFAMMTTDDQHDYLNRLESFRPGSLRLSQIIAELQAEIHGVLPNALAHFLANCKQIGVPRPR